MLREPREDGETEGMGLKQAPNMKMDVVRGAAVTWQAFHQTSSCTPWRRKTGSTATPCTGGGKNFLERVNLNITLVLKVEKDADRGYDA